MWILKPPSDHRDARSPEKHSRPQSTPTHSCNNSLTEDMSAGERERLTNEVAQQTPIQSQPSIYNGPIVTTPSIKHTHTQTHSPRFDRLGSAQSFTTNSSMTAHWRIWTFLKGSKRTNTRFLSSARHKIPQRARVNYRRNSTSASIQSVFCALQAHKMSCSGEEEKHHTHTHTHTTQNWWLRLMKWVAVWLRVSRATFLCQSTTAGGKSPSLTVTRLCLFTVQLNVSL